MEFTPSFTHPPRTQLSAQRKNWKRPWEVTMWCKPRVGKSSCTERARNSMWTCFPLCYWTKPLLFGNEGKPRTAILSAVMKSHCSWKINTSGLKSKKTKAIVWKAVGWCIEPTATVRRQAAGQRKLYLPDPETLLQVKYWGLTTN